MNRYNYKGKSGTEYWVVTMVYSLDKYEWGVPDKTTRKLIGPSDGGGTGFGERDLDWAFADGASAHKAAALLSEHFPDVQIFCDSRVVEDD